ncbi:hypothetical protein [Sporosarcina ureae]|uniref:hypothetical protein n=1 Tax=Sporosarcina ureae TaxID=1571 RepID=UPI0026EF2B3C|nr:hypothetical protein [Sporosarcina ureae]
MEGAVDLLIGSLLDVDLGMEVSKGSAFWTRAGTWGIASSHEPTSGGAASCLMATAYPAVVPALLSG